MKLRIYTDTSVLGGCEDDEFREPSRRLIEGFANGELILVLSDLTLHELDSAPPAVKEVITQVPLSFTERVALSQEAKDLAFEYVSEGVIEPVSRADALHIGLASVAQVDVLVSWNFRHIVNLRRIRGYNSINLERGYPLLEIRTPWEIQGRLKTVRDQAPQRYDCVQDMRRIRDRLSAEIADMSYEELARWLRDHPYSDPHLQKLSEMAAQKADKAAK